MFSVTVILVLLGVQTAAASRAIPSAVKEFEAARAIGEKVVVPLCQAHLCNGTEGTKEQACSCEATCHRRRDCCLDVFTDEQVRDLLDTDLWVCRTSPRGRGPYAVVGRCPRNWTDSAVRERCENPQPKNDDPNTALPITSISTNLTYANIFCAHCNEGKIQPGQFQVKFRCNGRNVTDIQAALKDKECDAHLEELGLPNCERMDKTVTECPQEWTHPNASYARELRWRCDTYFAPITLNNTRYKNVFCAVCNGQTASDKEGIICRNSYYPVEQEFVLGLQGDLREGARIPGGSVDHCKPREVYDPFEKNCRKIACTNCGFKGTPILSYRSRSAVSSPCNMTILKEGQFAIDNETNDLTINGTGVAYRKEEYEFGRRDSESVVLLCLRESADSAPLFPQHYCERRTLLGYGSCGCEPDCVRTRSCCLDSPAVVLNPSELSDAVDADLWACLPDVLGTSVITKCRNFNSTEEEDLEVKSKCELNTTDEDDVLLIIPVFSVNDSNVYRNIYCAACSGATEVIFHDLHFLCAEHATYRNGAEAASNYHKDKGLCALHTEPPDPNLPVHFCVQSPDCKRCPQSWENQNQTKNETGTDDIDRRKLIQWQCDHSYAPVSVNGTCYRSEFCALCNGIDLSDPKIERRYYSDSRSRLPSFQDPRFTTFTIG